ncbi:MAG: gephyrin-like molybdotransferase Glp [Candidatus Bathyarchaeia archaeon]|jgi:putative molybdopterin biosynthesis protein
MFRKLLTFDEAKKVIESQFKAKPLGVEEISLLGSSNRVLAENITADMDIPPFNRSTVDGYAVRAEDTFGAEENRPIVLHVSGAVNIGELPETTVRKGEAAEIVTGAPMPEGADAVVMMEYTNRKGDEVTVFSAAAKNENIMKAGSDIKKGETVLRKGQLLGSREIGVLAALGKSKARVYTVPRIAILSTGPEITEPGRKLPPGKIYDINAYTLYGAVLESGGNPIHLGVVPDRADELHEALVRALACSDMVVTSGGVSVGPKDIMPKTVDALGKPGIIVGGIALKPGKPTTVASVAGKPVFSLPGHPTSALLTFLLFARPLIQAMSGRKNEKPQEVKALASMRMFPARGRRTFIMVTLKHKKPEGLIAEPIQTALSGAITTLARADGFVEIAEDVQFIDAGEPVTVKLFRNESNLRDN